MTCAERAACFCLRISNLVCSSGSNGSSTFSSGVANNTQSSLLELYPFRFKNKKHKENLDPKTINPFIQIFDQINLYVTVEWTITGFFFLLPLLANSSTFCMYTSSSFWSFWISWLRGVRLSPFFWPKPESLVGGDWPTRGKDEAGYFCEMCCLVPGRATFSFGLETFNFVLLGLAASSY